MATFAEKRWLDRLLRPMGYRRFTPLKVPLTSTAWDGDAFSTVGTAAVLDLSVVFKVPPGVSAVILQCSLRDSAAWGTDGILAQFGPSAANPLGLVARTFGGDVWASVMGPIPCDANGDLWYKLTASGVSTLDVILRVWGYWF